MFLDDFYEVQYGMLHLIVSETTCEHSLYWLKYEDDDGETVSKDVCEYCKFFREHVNQVLTIGTTKLLISNESLFPFTAEKAGSYTFTYTGDSYIAAWLLPEADSAETETLDFYVGTQGFTFNQYMSAGQTVYLALCFMDGRVSGSLFITVKQGSCAHIQTNSELTYEYFQTGEQDIYGHQRWVVVTPVTTEVCKDCGLPAGSTLPKESGWITEEHTWIVDESDGEYVCSVCDYVCDHPVRDSIPRVPATRSLTGLSACNFCDICGKVLGAQEVLPVYSGTLFIQLSDDTVKIDDYAFADTGIEYVIVPDGCTKIGEYAFSNCNSLYMVELPASVTEIADTAFYYTNVYLLVPAGSYAQTYAEENDIFYRVK